MMEKLTKAMENLKKQNPNVSWANLLTGVAVLVMVAVFSYAYFSRSGSDQSSIDINKALEEVTKEDKEVNQEAEPTGAVVEDATPEIPAESGEKGSTGQTETAVVLKGEGLWQVAQRVCGDGEKYNILASANGLSVWEGLPEGMTLKVVCK
ncbi:MAG: hypothetical protein UW82_C0016G0014 [candidate division WWE3 bacterium GW2011_GWC2_44_9]|uniref:LysM domain-containing protein n=1 Tax=candidate division WWE3 bacterium GW2011_GWC2_44_9 TaxID=1619125 RepID=A0A0G1KMA5_UNCKA|nr:MAG: hypothetical protein UW82_C0016G0014 [candidate division WWE3 bacterium GW2011_GWC2_44_9]